MATKYGRKHHAYSDRILENAMETFWETIAKQHPEVQSGDFPPDDDHKFSVACYEAYNQWLRFNYSLNLKRPGGPKVPVKKRRPSQRKWKRSL